MSILAVSIAAAALLLAVTLILRGRAKTLPLPPGPRGLPILGSLLDIPKEKPWLGYSGWQRQYGDLMYFTVLGQEFLIISSLKIASDLLEKRSAIYSGRMHFNFGGDLVGWDKSMTLVEGQAHRLSRKMANTGLNRTALKQYEAVQEREAFKTLRKLLERPEDFKDHFKSNSGSTIMMIAYGYEPTENDDPLLRDAQAVLNSLSVGLKPGNWLVDFIPLLKYMPEWVPGAKFQKIAREWRALTDRMLDTPFQMVKEQMKSGTALPSMTAQLLQTAKEPTDDEHIKWAVGSLFGGGSDSTSSALHSFILAMVLYPDVQRKARGELDRVVGTDRLPTFADHHRLPYMEALVKEILRWAPVVPISMPHRLSEEDQYNGYRIPKNALLMPNMWHMSRDKATYGDDVEDFSPERFLGPSPAPMGFTTANSQEFGSPVFGFGRRVCPGQLVVVSTLFIVCSNILSTLEISPVMDADGKELLPGREYEGGLLAHPKPFQCRITTRSQKAIDLIMAKV